MPLLYKRSGDYISIGQGVCRFDTPDSFPACASTLHALLTDCPPQRLTAAACRTGGWIELEGAGGTLATAQAKCDAEPTCVAIWSHTNGGFQAFCSTLNAVCTNNGSPAVGTPTTVNTSGDQHNPGYDDCWKKASLVENTWGASFLLGLTVCAVLYVGGGIALGRRQGTTSAGLAQHPHHRKWQELGGLARDGWQYFLTQSSGKPRARRGDLSEALQPQRLGSRKPSREGSRSSKKSSSKSSRASEPPEVDGEDRSERVDGDTPGPGASTEAVATADGTAAGGGGRWVHVPS